MAQPDSPDTHTPARRRRTLRVVSEAAIGLAVGLVLLASVGIVLLSRGPISVSALNPMIEDALNSAESPYRIRVADTQIVWSGWDRALDVIATDVTVAEPERKPLAVLPEVSVGLSFKALLAGTVRLKTLELLRPEITLVRAPDGGLTMALNTGAEDSAGSETGPIAVPRADDDTFLPRPILDALTAGLDQAGVLGGIQRFSIVQAEVRMIDQALGETLYLHSTGIDIDRSLEGISAQLVGSLETPTEMALVGATLRVLQDQQQIEAVVSFDSLDTDLPVRYVPDLVFYLPDMTISGNVGAVFDFEGRPVRFAADLDSAAGRINARADVGTGGFPALSVEASLDAVDAAVWLGGLYEAQSALNYLPRVSVTGTVKADLDASLRPRAAAAEISSEIGDAALWLEARGDGGDIGGELTFTGIRPDRIAETAPYLGAAAGIDLPIDGSVDFALAPDLTPQRVRVTATAGAGTVTAPDLSAPLPALTGARLSARMDGPAGPIVVDGAMVDFGGPTVDLGATLNWDDAGATLDLNALALDLPMNRLPEFWPAELAENPRSWVTENIPEADVLEAGLSVRLSLPGRDPDRAVLERMDGAIRFENAKVHYLRPWKPVTGVSGLAVYNEETFDIDLFGGRLDDAELRRGRIEISGFETGEEKIAIDVRVATPVPTVLALLDTEPQRFISRLGVDPAGIEGNGLADLRFRFPLLKDLTGDEIVYEADAVLDALRAPRPELGGTITADGLSLTLRPGTLALEGPIALDGILIDASVRENFDGETEPEREFSLKTVAYLSELERFGLDLTGIAGGRAGIGVNYAAYRNGQQSVSMTANLAEAGLSIAPFDWHKPPGVPSDLTVRAVIDSEGGVRLENVLLDGRDHHRIEGAASLAPETLEISAARVDVLRYGNTDIAGTLRRTDGIYDIQLHGPRFDVAPFLGSAGDTSDEPDAEPRTEPKLRIVGRFDALSDGPDRFVRDAELAIDVFGDTVDLLTFQGAVGDDKRIDVNYVPTETGGHDLFVMAEDTGMALAVADVTGRLDGGSLRIEGRSADAQSPMIGRLTMKDFTFKEAPRLAKILEVISVTGILSALNDTGISFNSLVADFQLDESRLEIMDAAARGDSMGITAAGTIDRLTDTLDLRGDVAVSGIFSATLGQIPIIDLLVGEGLIGAAYTMTGPIDDPEISVNPLSVIAPGFLRKVFSADPDQTAPPKKNRTDSQRGN